MVQHRLPRPLNRLMMHPLLVREIVLDLMRHILRRGQHPFSRIRVLRLAAATAVHQHHLLLLPGPFLLGAAELAY